MSARQERVVQQSLVDNLPAVSQPVQGEPLNVMPTTPTVYNLLNKTHQSFSNQLSKTEAAENGPNIIFSDNRDTTFLVKVKTIGTTPFMVKFRIIGTTPVMIIGPTKILMATMVLAPKKFIVITVQSP